MEREGWWNKALVREISLTSCLQRKEVREISLIWAFLICMTAAAILKHLVQCTISSSIHHLFFYLICCTCQREKRKWGESPSPPSFKGRRWGKYPSSALFSASLNTNTMMKQHNEFRISLRVYWYLSFVSIIMPGCCAVNLLHKTASFPFEKADLWDRVNYYPVPNKKQSECYAAQHPSALW